VGADELDLPGGLRLTYLAGPHGSIQGPARQRVLPGENGAPVTATPDTDYEFIEWSDGSSENPRLDDNVREDISVEASFGIGGLMLSDLSRASCATGILRAGESLYTDRDFVFEETILRWLQVRQYILTPNDDKLSTDAQYLSFNISIPAYVIVALDSRITTPPLWMSSWQKLSEQLSTSDWNEITGGSRTLYRRRFPAGQVWLGGNQNEGEPPNNGISMYNVIIVPDPETGVAPEAWIQYR